MNNYLLTGSNGFLGKHVKATLERMGVVADINDLSGKRIDITHTFHLEEGWLPDIVVHIAGKAHSIPKTDEEKKAFFDVNFEGTKNLCNAIDELPALPKGFVFISTVSVYGKETGIEISEEFPLLGESPYAMSKIMAENYLKDWGAKKNIPVLILRIPLIAGENPPGNLGKMIKGINSGRYLSINGGKARRSMVMAGDIANCIADNAGNEGVYNICDGYHPSFRELEIIISQQLKKKLPLSIPDFIAVLMGKFGDLFHKFPVNSDVISKMSQDLTFDDSKARKDLGWRPQRVIDVFHIT